MAKAKRVSNNDAGREIAGKRPFRSNSGSFTGVAGSTDTGVMPHAEAEAYRASKPTYTVRSYATPIAWHTEEGGWHGSSTKYSSTTSRHQGIVGRSVHFGNGAAGARG